MTKPQKIARPSHRLDDFFRHESFESLARSQGVSPATSLENLRGGWPEDQLDDGFEAAILTWRQGEERREPD